MGDDRSTQVAEAKPRRRARIELKPRCAKREMVDLTRTAHSIDPVCDTLQSPVVDQSSEGARTDLFSARLRAGDQPPLFIRNFDQSLCRTRHTAEYTVSRILCSH